MTEPKCPFNPTRIWNGFVVPFSLIWRRGQKPDFKTLDPSRYVQCVQRGLCGICGEALPAGETWAWIGGRIDARNQDNFVFIDPPMHVACATYSAQACPFLAGGRVRDEAERTIGHVTLVKDRGDYFVHYGRGIDIIPPERAKSRVFLNRPHTYLGSELIPKVL